MPQKHCYRLNTDVVIDTSNCSGECRENNTFEGPNSCSKAMCKFSTVGNMARMMYPARAKEFVDYTDSSLERVCDICGKSINITALKVIEPTRIVDVTEKGFAPGKLPLLPAGQTLAQVWDQTVAKNKAVNWGLCKSCHADVEYFEITGEPRPAKSASAKGKAGCLGALLFFASVATALAALPWLLR